jgi:hypothetical protein
MPAAPEHRPDLLPADQLGDGRAAVPDEPDDLIERRPLSDSSDTNYAAARAVSTPPGV